MAEVSDAIGRQLGLVAAEETIKPRTESKEEARSGDGARRHSDGSAECGAELVVAPTAFAAVIGLDEALFGSPGASKREEQLGQVVNVEQRELARRRRIDLSARAILNKVRVSLSPGP